MIKKTVVLIKSNLMNEETRRPKEAKTLNYKYKVIVVSWDRGRKSPITQQHRSNDYYEEECLKFKAPFQVKGILFLPIWWCFLFFKLALMKWDIAHVVNFDSLIPVLIIGKIKKKPVIYEILDTYIDLIILPGWIRQIGIDIDRFFIRLASAVIIADDLQVEEIGGISNNNVIPIYDSPRDTKIINDHCMRNENFTMFFAGGLFLARRLNLDKIFVAISSINRVKLVIAGYGDLIEEIKEWSGKMPDKIQFIGEITHAEVLERSTKSDLLFVLRDPVVPVNKYICGSKILEAMMCGRPILVNKGTSTANILLEENCGLVVDAENIEEIREAIIKLRDDPKLCEELGKNARRAYEERYSWEIMEQRLLTIYGELTKEIT
jgi:glycosyltransferase involved in cell wall biosynthesis